MAKPSETVSLLNKAISKSLKQLHARSLIESQLIQKSGKLQFHYQEISLAKFPHIYVFGAGKCSKEMASGMEALLGTHLQSGCVITNNDDPNIKLDKIQVLEGSHPYPSESGVKNSQALLEMAKKVEPNSLVIFLLSGGASAIFEVPKETSTLSEINLESKSAIESGKTIQELNQIRSSHSLVKNGGFLNFINNATCLSIVLSDVPGDSPKVIGSGPTYAPDLDPNKNIWWLLGSNSTALNVLRDSIPQKKYPVLVDDKSYSGSVENLATHIVANIRSVTKKSCLLFGGESYVACNTTAIGGRNQHLAMLLAEELINEDRSWTIACLGTDGIDGNSEIAGVIIDKESILPKKEKFLDELRSAKKSFESTKFWKDWGHPIQTGPTGTNLMDVVICLLEKA